MKKSLLASALGAVGIGRHIPDEPLTPAQYTAEYVRRLRRHSPKRTITVVADLELTIGESGQGQLSVLLENSYQRYLADPRKLATIINDYIKAFLEANITHESIATSRVIPVVKHLNWLTQIRASLKRHAPPPPNPDLPIDDDAPTHVHDPLCQNLVVLYAEDSPRSVRYLTPLDLENVGLDPARLRSLAIKNLSRLLPKIEVRGSDGTYILSADGTYEASLILLDPLWTDSRLQVNGDFVFAAPSREFLVVTGSEDTENISRLRLLAQHVFSQSPYGVSPDLYIRHPHGKIELLNEEA